MTTFDQILPLSIEILVSHRDRIAQLEWLVINRDLNGRVRFIAPEQLRDNAVQRAELEAIYTALSERLAPHSYSAGSGILYEASRELTCQGASHFALSELDNVWVVDRLVTEANWSSITPETESVPRIVFFSIKGGGRSLHRLGSDRMEPRAGGQAGTGA
ncbi:hypothetical protein ACM71O_27140 [Pseudomonas aeruginosa]|uniref:hypothetical protein n=1 Tax=Pseudomonas aeruginosa TaxID=287 RepID=UPI001ED9BE0F|nr:hypothetical protein [Pseudomonas aeruginosa]